MINDFTPSHVWEQVTARLMDVPFSMTRHGDNLRDGVCPKCGKKSLWAKYADQAGRVWCNRESKCKYTATAKELFPDLFDPIRIVKDYPATPEKPNATADAYLKQIRGFDISKLKGWYTQQTYSYYPKEAKESGLPAQTVTSVRFPLSDPMKGAWDRFLDGEHFGKKTYLSYGTELNGWLWTPPDQVLNYNDNLYITEGIFDALALYQHDYKVGALMGATNKPEQFIKAHAHQRLTYVIALDNDTAGRNNTIKLHKWLREQDQRVRAIQPALENEGKIDWNDQHLHQKLSPANLKDYEYYGNLLTASRPEKRGRLMYQRTGNQFFVYEHDNQTYVWNLDIDKLTKAQEEIRRAEEMKDDDELDDDQLDEALTKVGAVTHLANCGFDFLYTQRNPVTDELFYFFRIRHEDGRQTLNTFTGTQLSAAADFRKRLLSAASGALIKADLTAHNWLLTRWMSNIKDVDVVGFAGYSAVHKAWIYPHFAMYKGKYLPKNGEDYVELSTKTRVKSAYHNVSIDINPKFNEYNDTWFNDLYVAWGAKGVLALAFWTLSLFAQQVRDLNKSLFFMELVGDPGTGKTTLIEFLWRLFGRDAFEGFDPSSSNPAYIARTLNQIANLPVVMIEGDRGVRTGNHRAKFDWSETKKLYNGRSMKGRGMRTQGNETYEPPFLGSLVISQNAPVDAEQAVLERICHIYFHKNDANSQTLASVKQLTSIPLHNLSGYLIKCLSQAEQLLNIYKEWQPKFEEQYRTKPEQKTYRLALNHSQLAAAVKMLPLVCPIGESSLNATLAEIERMAIEREKAIALEHPDVEQFFEVLAYLDDKSKINHDTEGKGWAINLNEVYEKAHYYQQQLAPPTLLKPLLRVSRRFDDCKVFHSKSTNKSLRCWLFKNK